MAAGNGDQVNGYPDDRRLLLKTDKTEFLIRNNGNQVKISDMLQKITIFYFPSSSDEESSKEYTELLTKIYNELAKDDIEIILISDAKDEDSFNILLSDTPFLAVPFSNQSTVRERLVEALGVKDTPHIEILGKDGKVSKLNADSVLYFYGAEAYPFTEERIKEIKEEKERAKENQTLTSLLASKSRDFLIKNDGTKVPISELEGKMVGIYISLSWYRSCHQFLPRLKEIHSKLKERGESFEVVYVSMDKDEEIFKTDFKDMPWLAVPYHDETRTKLSSYFELTAIPTLAIIGTDGKTLKQNVTHYINMHGIEAYPFTQEKLSQLEEIEKAKHESQTLESLLVTEELDFVLRKDGVKVPVSELVGKTVLFYFSRKECPPCQAFTPKLVEAYNVIKAKHDDLEAIFVSVDNSQQSFEEYYSKMPWLVLPYDDVRETHLRCMLKLPSLPHLEAVGLGPNGRTILKEAIQLVLFFGSDAYPFDQTKEKEMYLKLEEMAKSLPEKVNHKLHPQHELVRSRSDMFYCRGCEEYNSGWMFECEGCYFALDSKCALGDGDLHQDEGTTTTITKDGWVCEGDVCYRA